MINSNWTIDIFFELDFIFYSNFIIFIIKNDFFINNPFVNFKFTINKYTIIKFLNFIFGFNKVCYLMFAKWLNYKMTRIKICTISYVVIISMRNKAKKKLFWYPIVIKLFNRASFFDIQNKFDIFPTNTYFIFII